MSDHLEEGETNDHVTEYTDSALFSVEGDRDPKGKYQFSRKCIFCKGHHWSDKCSIINDPHTRKKYLKKNKLCFRCFKKDHTSRNCKKEKKLVFTVRDCIILRYAQNETRRMQIKTQQ